MSDIIKALAQPLNISDVDFRLQSINNGGYATILAYKDARVDMNRLDAVCGMNWQKDFKLIDSKLFCGVGIKFNEEWIWRWDVGVESNAEKEKGQASDSFKRAAFCWGIGRELYNYPIIQIKLEPNEFEVVQGQKPRATWNLQIKSWKWDSKFDDNGDLIYLSAVDQNGKQRFVFNNQQTMQNPYVETSEQKLNKATTLEELGKIYTSLSKEEKVRTMALKEELKTKLTIK